MRCCLGPANCPSELRRYASGTRSWIAPFERRFSCTVKVMSLLLSVLASFTSDCLACCADVVVILNLLKPSPPSPTRLVLAVRAAHLAQPSAPAAPHAPRHGQQVESRNDHDQHEHLRVIGHARANEHVVQVVGTECVELDVAQLREQLVLARRHRQHAAKVGQVRALTYECRAWRSEAVELECRVASLRAPLRRDFVPKAALEDPPAVWVHKAGFTDARPVDAGAEATAVVQMAAVRCGRYEMTARIHNFLNREEDYSGRDEAVDGELGAARVAEHDRVDGGANGGVGRVHAVGVDAERGDGLGVNVVLSRVADA
eukprot:1191762-Pleurochrysis_carterae.AAC.2